MANTLYYGDNLDVLHKHVATESVDLIYLDPPFNSNRSYNVLFKAHSGEDSQAQAEAAGAAQGCSNAFSCIVQDPGSIASSFSANRGQIAVNVGVVLGVAAAATGVGAIAEGSLLLAGSAFGLAAGGSLLDGPQCISGHNTAACAGLILNGGAALAGGASFGALVLGAEGASALLGAFGINVGLGGLTTDIVGALLGLDGRSQAC